ncbi:MAG TPA: STY0301 family protein [Burkholderiales bacterium]|nr:STY0301 family protein [Burkholderiales bacterium]
MRNRLVALALPGLMAGAVGDAAGAEVSCPDRLTVEQRAQAPDGWVVSYSGIGPRLSGVSIFDGQPANRVSLKHTRRRQARRELILTWDLSHSPRSHYLQCSYERTTASISMPLPPGTTQCEVAYDLTSSYPGGAMPVKRMVCR